MRSGSVGRPDVAAPHRDRGPHADGWSVADGYGDCHGYGYGDCQPDLVTECDRVTECLPDCDRRPVSVGIAHTVGIAVAIPHTVADGDAGTVWNAVTVRDSVTDTRAEPDVGALPVAVEVAAAHAVRIALVAVSASVGGPSRGGPAARRHRVAAAG